MPSLTRRSLPAILVGVALSAAAPALASVLLSEILADPASDWNGDGQVTARGDEWIEVLNTGPQIVDLADYYLRDALGAEPHLRLSGMLAPGQVAVFYGSDAEAWQASVGLTITGLSLNNAGDTVELLLGDPLQPGSQLADAYIYLPHEAVDDRASGRLADLTWGLFDGLNPYTGTLLPAGTGCMPSPGLPNNCQPLVPGEAVTWGGVKSLFD